MGALREGQAAIANANSESAKQARELSGQAASAVIGNLGTVLDEPEYVGDVETALIHHMGESALHKGEVTGLYTDLVERIEAETGRHVPVLLVFNNYDEEGTPTTRQSAFVSVRSESIRFKSKNEREEDVRMHALSSETAGVTHKSLSLFGTTSVFRGSILTPNQPLGHMYGANSFVLSESHVADDGRGTRLGDYAYSDTHAERLDENTVVLVGWKQIEEALVDTLLKGSNKLQEANKLKAFFETTSTLKLDVMRNHTPRIAMVVERAEKFESAVGSLALEPESK